MEVGRILIAIINEATTAKLKHILLENGYLIVDTAKDGSECLRKVRILKPDLVIIDSNLPVMSGVETSKIILEDNLADIIMISTAEREVSLDKLNTESSCVCVTKPINKQSLINTIDLMVKNRKKIRQLEKEIEDLKANLDTRKEVEKAKGLLMKNLNLSEGEAFKRIQKQSMDRGIPMKEIAKAIILAYDI